MSGDTPRPVWMSENHAAAIWVAHCRLKASAARNLAESGDAEGDDDFAELLLDLVAAHNRAPADPVEAVARGIAGYQPSLFVPVWEGLNARDQEHYLVASRAYLKSLGYPGLAPDTKEDTT